MKAPLLRRIVLIVVGYLTAFGVGALAVWTKNRFTPAADQVASSGMHAFGDLLLFAVFAGIPALVVTAALLFFLRDKKGFWNALSVLMLAVAAFGLVSAVAVLGQI